MSPWLRGRLIRRRFLFKYRDHPRANGIITTHQDHPTFQRRRRSRLTTQVVFSLSLSLHCQHQLVSSRQQQQRRRRRRSRCREEMMNISVRICLSTTEYHFSFDDNSSNSIRCHRDVSTAKYAVSFLFPRLIECKQSCSSLSATSSSRAPLVTSLTVELPHTLSLSSTREFFWHNKHSD